MKRLFFLAFLCVALHVSAQETVQPLALEKGVSKAQIQLMNDLSARRKWLEQQAKSRPSVQAQQDAYEQDVPLSPVVQMYLYMSPVDSARPLTQMPEEEAFDIFSQIPSYRAALILAKLPPEVAKRWTIRLARRNENG